MKDKHSGGVFIALHPFVKVLAAIVSIQKSQFDLFFATISVEDGFFWPTSSTLILVFLINCVLKTLKNSMKKLIWVVLVITELIKNDF